MLVGGMPMPVIKYIENDKSFFEADKEKRDILSLYREDIMKINARYRSKVLAIFDQIPVLLVSHAFDENELLEEEVYKQILLDKLSLNEDMLYENAIAQMFVVNKHKLYFYTRYNIEKHRNDIEIDFLLSNNSKLKYKLYPIDVKSSKKYSISSLLKFKEKYKNRIGACYVIHPKNFTIKDSIVCIPPYMTFML